MLSVADNRILTETGPDTPMGQYFRRFWQPVALSEELAEPDGAPLKVRVLGEELVAFRDTEGGIGLLEAYCPHRRAHLYYGRNEACGLRCVYHGWKFDVNGKPVDLPNVTPDSPLYKHVSVKAYPTREFGEIVWAWLGPPDRMPEVPQLEMGMLPASQRFVTKKLQDCNWAQSIEGALDTAHFSFLHMPAPAVPSNANPDAPADEARLRWIREDPMPRFSFVDHDVGFVIGGARTADDGRLYWRTTQFMLPSHATTPSTLPGENHYGYTFVPIDDRSCWIYTYVWNPERPIGDEERATFRRGHGVVGEVGPGYVPVRNRANDYLIDRENQKHVSFTGVRGVAEQDAMIQESQGYVVDRSKEHLTPTDLGIVRFRRAVLQGAKALSDGSEPAAPWHPAAFRLRSGSWIGDAGVPFEEVMRRRFGHAAGLVEEATEPA